MPATVDVAITAVAASTKAVDAIEVESLVGDWGFEVGAEKVYFRLPPPPFVGNWGFEVSGTFGSSLGALWELSGSSLGARRSCEYPR